MSNLVLVDTRNSVRSISLNFPARRNALSLELRAALIDALRQANGDDDVKAILLTGEGGCFCAGGDITSMHNLTGVGGRARLQRVHELVRLMAAGPKPIVAAVEGHAAGAGMSIALLCDQVVAARDARFCLSFNKIGLMPDLGALWTVPQRVNAGWARKLLMLGEEVSGEKGAEIGLVDELVEPGNAREAAQALAERFARSAPIPLAYIKSALARGPQALEALLALEADTQAILMTSEDFQEGRDAFLGKRKPSFKGR